MNPHAKSVVINCMARCLEVSDGSVRQHSDDDTSRLMLPLAKPEVRAKHAHLTAIITCVLSRKIIIWGASLIIISLQIIAPNFDDTLPMFLSGRQLLPRTLIYSLSWT